jgi:Arc/MetJ-type ribon-helix-helix transcriptional regulator
MLPGQILPVGDGCPLGCPPVLDRRLSNPLNALAGHSSCPAAPTGYAGGMVIGMATRKVTITLDEAQLDQIRSLVQAGTAASVSGFVQHAVAVALDDVAGWGAMLAEALRATGGELSDKERAWADEVLGTGTQPAA